MKFQPTIAANFSGSSRQYVCNLHKQMCKIRKKTKTFRLNPLSYMKIVKQRKNVCVCVLITLRKMQEHLIKGATHLNLINQRLKREIRRKGNLYLTNRE